MDVVKEYLNVPGEEKPKTEVQILQEENASLKAALQQTQAAVDYILMNF